MSDSTAEIKSRLPMLDLARESTEMRPSGKNFKGCCPIHGEKTPSFFVSPDRDSFHCFGCGRGGDIFTFIQEMENCDFSESLRILAEKTGVPLRAEDPALREKRARLFAANAAAAEFFADFLKSPSGKIGADYFAGRGFVGEVAADFLLGYAPSAIDAAVKFLRGKNFTDAEIVEAGLAVRDERTGAMRDRFRGRVVFPIADHRGKIVGFSARALGDENPKYVNSPETPIYKKSSILFGFFAAKPAIREAGFALLVEGNADAVALHGAGFREAVATCGTALGADQAGALAKITGEVRLAFDADAAGRAAAARAIPILENAGLRVRLVRWPGSAKDPADALEKDRENFAAAVREAPGLADFFFAEAGRRFAGDGRGFAAAILPFVKTRPPGLESEDLLRRISRESGFSLGALEAELARTAPAWEVPAAGGAGKNFGGFRGGAGGEKSAGEARGFAPRVAGVPPAGAAQNRGEADPGEAGGVGRGAEPPSEFKDPAALARAADFRRAPAAFLALILAEPALRADFSDEKIAEILPAPLGEIFLAGEKWPGLPEPARGIADRLAVWGEENFAQTSIEKLRVEAAVLLRKLRADAARVRRAELRRALAAAPDDPAREKILRELSG